MGEGYTASLIAVKMGEGYTASLIAVTGTNRGLTAVDSHATKFIDSRNF